MASLRQIIVCFIYYAFANMPQSIGICSRKLAQ